MSASAQATQTGQPARSLTAPLILLLAAALRFYNLSGQSLWADEGNSAALVRHSISEIARRTAFDIHPPFYYWLLKSWTFIFGTSEIGLRSLSAVLGVALVYVIGILGTRWFSPRVGLLAAFIAAVSPLQIYYSQEARMYMLLTLLSSLTVLAASLLWEDDRRPPTADRRFFWLKSPAAWIYVLVVTAGLYTHYAYPLVLLAVNLANLLWFWQSGRKDVTHHASRITYHTSHFTLHNWLILQTIPILLYLPWLPIAWRQITTWPSEKQSTSLVAILETISTTLLFGLSWPFDWGLILVIGLAVILLLTILYASRLTPHASRLTLLWLWFLLPVLLTLIIFSPAFLKFLLVAAPTLALLLACAIETITHHASRITLKYLVGGLLLAVLASASALSLYHYFANPTYARDNYRGIANFIKAVGGPDDAVILNAEGQQDVFNYYFSKTSVPEAPVYPLPRRRPLDEAATLAELQTIAATAQKIYAVYWATQQADPHGLIESWLNTHLFKATDQWYGNVRLVSYASPLETSDLSLKPLNYQLGPHICLKGYTLSASQIAPGDILQVALSWQTDAPLRADENYTVFVQVLDQADHLVGQRDAAPLTPTSAWPANQSVADAHGIFIEPGTPPGLHRLIVGLYDSQTGQRLPVAEGQDFVELGQVEVIRPQPPLPPEAFRMHVPLNTPMLEVTLLGYDLYKVGFRSAPDTPFHPGDPVQLVAYWQAREPVRWLEDQLFIQVVTNSGEATPVFVTRPPAGTTYPIQDWREGEIIRAQYNFFLGDLSPGIYRLALTLTAQKTSAQRVVALTKPFRVE
ncbi:MAG: glycosyltransferase family 39 protein [Anaerolineae bacterium]|nr:glycosyltransferase family 39 protein [Anaerolineae bacterium]